MTTWMATAVASDVSEVRAVGGLVRVRPQMPTGISNIVGVGVVPGVDLTSSPLAPGILLPDELSDTPNANGEVSFSLVSTLDTEPNSEGVGVRYRVLWGNNEYVEFDMLRRHERVAVLAAAGATPVIISGIRPTQLAAANSPTVGNAVLIGSGNEFTFGVATGGVTVQDDGSDVLVAAGTINFTGAGVTATESGGVVLVDVPFDTQVQSDWDEADDTSAAYLENKPTIPDDTHIDARAALRYTNPEKSKLNGIADNANQLIPYKIGNIYRAFLIGEAVVKPADTEGTVTVAGIAAAPAGWQLTRPEATAAMPYVYDCHVYGYATNGVFGHQFGTPNRTDRFTDLSTYAPLASPALTGVPTVPTPPVGNNSTRIANTAYVVGQIAAAMLSGGADGVLGSVTFDDTTDSLVFTLAGQTTPLATVSIASLLSGVITAVTTASDSGLTGAADAGTADLAIAARGVTLAMMATGTATRLLGYDNLGNPAEIAALAWRDEGNARNDVSAVNFTGAGVTATVAGGVLTVSIPGGTSPIQSAIQFAALKATNTFIADDFTGSDGVEFPTGSHTVTLPSVSGAVYAAFARAVLEDPPNFLDINNQGINQFGGVTQQPGIITLNQEAYHIYVTNHALEYGGASVEFR